MLKHMTVRHLLPLLNKYQQADNIHVYTTLHYIINSHIIKMFVTKWNISKN